MNPSIILNKDFGVIDKPFTRSSGIKLRKAITLPFLQPILCSTGQGFAGFTAVTANILEASQKLPVTGIQPTTQVGGSCHTLLGTYPLKLCAFCQGRGI
jgi:hypothetical protein